MESNQSQNKKTILVVDDDLPVLDAIVEKLEREGFATLRSRNGEDGLAVALKTLPDLVLLDIIMPKLDGISMLKKLRAANEWGKKVPVILLTNLSPDKEDFSKSMEGCDPAHYLIKANWSLSDVIEKVRETLG